MTMARKRRGRGEGSIYYREDRQLWVCTISLGSDGKGKRRRRTVFGKTKAEVQAKLRKLQTRVDSGQKVDASALTVMQFFDSWLEGIKPTVAAYTYREYKAHVERYLKPKVGSGELTGLTALDVLRLYAELEKDGVSPAMRKKAGITLGVALQSAANLVLIPVNPARGVKKAKVEKRKMMCLDSEQTRSFLEHARSDRLYALYVLALDSGAREGELFALIWSDLDFEASAVSIQRSLEELADKLRVKECKTPQSRRRIILSAFTKAALQEHRKAMLAAGLYRADGTIFCDTEGGWLRKSNVRRRSFDLIVKAANVPAIRPYDLRHTWAKLLLLAGINPKVVSERLGHGSIRQTLDTYSHVLPSMQQHVADKLDAMFRMG
jgi:integrase